MKRNITINMFGSLYAIDELTGLITAKRLGRRAMQRINSNYFYTMLCNSLFLAGGIFMILTPALSAFLHNMTTVILSVRAMRRNLQDEDLALPQAIEARSAQ